MQLPAEFIRSLRGTEGFDERAFVKVHESAEQVTSIRINPFKVSKVKSEMSKENDSPFSTFTFHDRVPWTDHGFYLPQRPSFTFDPLFHAGCYYVQEASSMFLEQALKQKADLTGRLKLLDLCAAPGGKSTHLLSLITRQSLLVSNEVIRSRAGILDDNIIKWGCSNVVITNNDPKDFQQLENYFDVIVIDAPCSGSGLFRRDPEATGHWSEENVALCSQRQRRILADVLPSLKRGGILIYSTCSYSEEEDEEIVEWFKNEFPVHQEELRFDPGWNIINSGGGYRFWPDKLRGEGFFLACFRKVEGENGFTLPKIKPDKLAKQELDIAGNYLQDTTMNLIRDPRGIHAVPEELSGNIQFIRSKLRVMDYGTKLGEIIRDKLVPAHALAVSNIINKNVSRIALDYDEAIRYLKKKDLTVETDKKGWALVTYNGYPLGWINILTNRINNYYPKELRILKD